MAWGRSRFQEAAPVSLARGPRAGSATSKHCPHPCRQPRGLVVPLKPTLSMVMEDPLRRSSWPALAFAASALVAAPASGGTVRGTLWLDPPSPRAAGASAETRRAQPGVADAVVYVDRVPD